MADLPEWLSFARGPMPGARQVNLFGRNLDVDSGSLPEDVWTQGGLYNWLPAAAALEIVSTSVDDTALGTGMRTVVIEGLDAAWEPITATVSMNGVAAVAIPGLFYRVNFVRGVTAGTGEANLGIVVVRTVVGGTVVAHMEPGGGRSHHAAYTVPAGYTAWVMWLSFGIQRSQADFVEFDVLIRTPGACRTAGTSVTVHSNAGLLMLERPVPVPMPEKTDAWVRVTSASTNNLLVVMSAQFVLTKNRWGPSS